MYMYKYNKWMYEITIMRTKDIIIIATCACTLKTEYTPCCTFTSLAGSEEVRWSGRYWWPCRGGCHSRRQGPPPPRWLGQDGGEEAFPAKSGAESSPPIFTNKELINILTMYIHVSVQASSKLQHVLVFTLYCRYAENVSVC